jgi:aminocarboxymuconate-semialdehyde decarboxylase
MTISAIDMHSHFWPDGMLKAAAAGRPWHGWSTFDRRDGKGGVLAIGQRIAPFNPPQADLAEGKSRSEARWESQQISLEAVMPVGFMWNYDLEGVEARDCAREINEELAELEHNNPERYRGLAYLPLQDTAAAIAEVEHAVKELGLRSFAIGSNIQGRNVDDPSVVPVLEEIARAKATVTIHPPYWGKVGEPRFPRYQFARTFGAVYETGLSVASIMYSGILDRFPDLKVSFTHGGGTINALIGRLDLRYHGQGDSRFLQAPPSEYLQRFYYDCLMHDELALRSLIERIGHKHIMIGTDYPFDGDIPGGSTHWIRGLDWLEEDQKEDILWRNAASFLGLASDYRPIDPGASGAAAGADARVGGVR